MYTAGLRASLLLSALLAAAPSRAEPRREALAIGSSRLALGMSRDAVRAALGADPDFLVTRLGDSELVVSDTKAQRAVAILSFDRRNALRRIQKNWTPASDKALAFALALHQLAAQVAGGEPGEGRRACTLSAPRRSPIGPYAGVRDPGKPDLEIREVRLACGDQSILIHVRQPSATTKVAEVLQIERVLLYEAIGDAPDQPRGEPGGAAPVAQ